MFTILPITLTLVGGLTCHYRAPSVERTSGVLLWEPLAAFPLPPPQFQRSRIRGGVWYLNFQGEFWLVMMGLGLQNLALFAFL